MGDDCFIPGLDLEELSQQAQDREQQEHEILDALFRLEQSFYFVQGYDHYGTLRKDVETVAHGCGLLSELHKPLR